MVLHSISWLDMKSKVFVFLESPFSGTPTCLISDRVLIAYVIHRKNVAVPILKASARITTRLNYLCPQFFPAPGFWSLPDQNRSKLGSLSSSEVCCNELKGICFPG